jgi:sterol-4alpha-carboxylate 3-dehydrogenase (decarboxylating)
VQALIYTSSTSIVNVSASPSNEELTEEQAILYASNAKNATPYQKRTAEAEKLVLNANTNSSHGLQTVALRLAPIYGPGEPHDGPVRTALEMLKQGKQKIQVGDDSAVFERVYVGNAVRACLLAAKALLYADQYAGGKVAGEAFFITDATPPLSFYTFARKVWAASGDHTDPAEIRHVGRKFVSSTAWLDEILSPLLTLGLRRSSSLRKRAAVLELDHGTRFCVGKARQRLGYGVERMISVDAGIRKVVEAQNRWVERKKSVSVGKVGLARKKSVLMK